MWRWCNSCLHGSAPGVSGRIHIHVRTSSLLYALRVRGSVYGLHCRVAHKNHNETFGSHSLHRVAYIAHRRKLLQLTYRQYLYKKVLDLIAVIEANRFQNCPTSRSIKSRLICSQHITRTSFRCLTSRICILSVSKPL